MYLFPAKPERQKAGPCTEGSGAEFYLKMGSPGSACRWVFYLLLIFANLAALPVQAASNDAGDNYIIRTDKTAFVVAELALLMNDFESRHRDRLKVGRENERCYKIFFDTPDLFIYKNNSSLAYEATEYFTKTRNRRKFKETVLYRGIDRTVRQYPVHHYDKALSPVEKHPLLSLIKRTERDALLDRMSRDGIKFPMLIKTIFHLAENNITYKIFNKDEKLLCILRLAQAKATVGGKNRSLTLFSIDMGETTEPLGQAAPAWKSALLNEIGELMQDNSEPTDYKATNKTAYGLTLAYLENNIKFFHLHLRYPALLKTIYLLIAGFLTWVVVKQIKAKT
jgi:hypothetical protein